MVKYLLVGLTLLKAAADVDAGAWTLQRGQFWGKLTYFQQHTEEWYVGKGRFGAPGTRARYDFDGQYESRAVFFESLYGVTDRLDLGLQVPYFDQSFANAAFAEPRTDTGLSDIRALAKLRLLAKPLVLALKAGVKVPTGEFKNEDGLIPVGEGAVGFRLRRAGGALLLAAALVRQHRPRLSRPHPQRTDRPRPRRRVVPQRRDGLPIRASTHAAGQVRGAPQRSSD